MSISMKNPVTELRERLDLSRKVFSMAYGVPFSTMNHRENGFASRINDGLIEAFRRAGISREDLEDIQECYAKWRKEVSREAIAKKKALG
ncbi:MAG: hypothetical protein AB9903_34305 [Vulcanimicrobiota bacterium]